MAQEYADKGISFVFVYTREAHPGENIPALRSLEQKISHAMTFKQQLGIERPILVDDLTGTGHKAYGELSNMTYLVGQGGRVLFRADWTDPPTIEVSLKYLLAARAQRRKGLRMTPFYAEFVGYRWSDETKADEIMARGGQQAMDDMDRVYQRWAKQGPRPGQINL